MFYMRSNFKQASAIAGKTDIDLYHSIGVDGINKLVNREAIIQRLVNSNILDEGKY